MRKKIDVEFIISMLVTLGLAALGLFGVYAWIIISITIM